MIIQLFPIFFSLFSVSTKNICPLPIPPKIRKRILYHFCVENNVQMNLKQILHWPEADPTVHYVTPDCKLRNIYTHVYT